MDSSEYKLIKYDTIPLEGIGTNDTSTKLYETCLRLEKEGLIYRGVEKPDFIFWLPTKLYKDIRDTSRRFAASFRWDKEHRTEEQEDGFITGSLSDTTKALWQWYLKLQRDRFNEIKKQ